MVLINCAKARKGLPPLATVSIHAIEFSRLPKRESRAISYFDSTFIAFGDSRELGYGVEAEPRSAFPSETFRRAGNSRLVTGDACFLWANNRSPKWQDLSVFRKWKLSNKGFRPAPRGSVAYYAMSSFGTLILVWLS